MQRNPVTIKDIATRLGIAHSTVSRALNNNPLISLETKNRVREAALRLGYITNQGARSMRVGTSRLVGLIVPDVENEFYSAAARAMAEQCTKRGYQLILGVSEDDPGIEEVHIRSLREGRAAGLLIVPTPVITRTSIKLLQQIPTVQFLRDNPKVGKLAILADDMAGVAAATTHLLELGHRRIGFIGVGTQASTGQRRAAGYQSALRAHRLNVDAALMRMGPPRPSFGAEALQSLLLDTPAMTGVVVASSRQLLGVLRTAHAKRLAIPARLSVVGYGDADWLEVSSPPLSAVALSVEAMSARATQVLFARLETQALPRKREPVFSTQLIVRASTGPACAITTQPHVTPRKGDALTSRHTRSASAKKA